jgi:hypothetical protein
MTDPESHFASQIILWIAGILIAAVVLAWDFMDRDDK